MVLLLFWFFSIFGVGDDVLVGGFIGYGVVCGLGGFLIWVGLLVR